MAPILAAAPAICCDSGREFVPIATHSSISTSCISLTNMAAATLPAPSEGHIQVRIAEPVRFAFFLLFPPSYLSVLPLFLLSTSLSTGKYVLTAALKTLVPSSNSYCPFCKPSTLILTQIVLSLGRMVVRKCISRSLSRSLSSACSWFGRKSATRRRHPIPRLNSRTMAKLWLKAISQNQYVIILADMHHQTALGALEWM